MVVAVLALSMSVGGTAYAAKLITSQDIKNSTIRSVDVKNGSLRGADLKDGTVGLADLSPAVKSAISSSWDPSKTLVRGQTITGSTYYQIDSSSAGQQLNQTVAFPARAPAALKSANFAPDTSAATTDDDPTCTGTYSAPTAPPGQLCAYSESTFGVTAVNLTTLFPGEDKGFVVRATAAGAGGITIDMSWAYRAP
jgi:hypothetical protein